MPGGDARPGPVAVREALAGTRFADVRWVVETGSTNSDLMALAADGAPEGLVLVADHQVAGRGRLGRVWTAPPSSSLLVSILLRPPFGPAGAHALTTAVALSAREACERVAGVMPGLKWPNDLVAAPHGGGPERKLAGVLAESMLGGNQFEAVVVGIGLNVNWPDALPSDIADVAVSLNHLTGQRVDREALLVALLAGLDRRYTRLLEAGGHEDLRAEEVLASATLGRQVRVLRSRDELLGTAVGLEADGALLVDVDADGDGDGDLIVVPVGDVIHLRPQPAEGG